MNKKIKNAFSGVNVSEKLERNILNMTVNKQKQAHRIFKLSYLCSIAVAICLLSVTIVYAKEINEFFQSWSTSINLKNGTKVKISENNNFKEIPTDAIKVKDNSKSPKMTFKEVEEMLKFSILKLPENNTKDIYYRTSLNDDGSIGRVDLWIPYFYRESDNKYISVSVNILNKYADEGYVLAFQEGIDATGDKIIDNSYKSDNLNTNIVVYTNDWSKERLTVSFVYDDILYQFIGKNISKDEMAYIIETLK
ncbi:MAG: hypothetical protein ACI33S_05145 [Bacilli bacterium]